MSENSFIFFRKYKTDKAVLVSFAVLADLARRVRNVCDDGRNNIHGEVKDKEHGGIIVGIARSDC